MALGCVFHLLQSRGRLLTTCAKMHRCLIQPLLLHQELESSVERQLATYRASEDTAALQLLVGHVSPTLAIDCSALFLSCAGACSLGEIRSAHIMPLQGVHQSSHELVNVLLLDSVFQA